MQPSEPIDSDPPEFATGCEKLPSANTVNTTSVGMLRIIEVIGAIVTQIKTGIAESRVYQQTSPRFAAPQSCSFRQPAEDCLDLDDHALHNPFLTSRL